MSSKKGYAKRPKQVQLESVTAFDDDDDALLLESHSIDADAVYKLPLWTKQLKKILQGVGFQRCDGTFQQRILAVLVILYIGCHCGLVVVVAKWKGMVEAQSHKKLPLGCDVRAAVFVLVNALFNVVDIVWLFFHHRDNSLPSPWRTSDIYTADLAFHKASKRFIIACIFCPVLYVPLWFFSYSNDRDFEIGFWAVVVPIIALEWVHLAFTLLVDNFCLAYVAESERRFEEWLLHSSSSLLDAKQEMLPIIQLRHKIASLLSRRQTAYVIFILIYEVVMIYDYILMPFHHISMLFLAFWLGGMFIAGVPQIFLFNHAPDRLRRNVAITFESGVGTWAPSARLDFFDFLENTREKIVVFNSQPVEPGAVYTMLVLLFSLAFTLWQLKESKVFGAFSFDKTCAYSDAWKPHAHNNSVLLHNFSK